MTTTKSFNQIIVALAACASIFLSSCKEEEPLQIVIVKTNEATIIGGETVTIEGEINANGASVTKRGACISTLENPTMLDGHVISTSTSDKFTVEVNNLNTNTKYYYRAFAMVGSQVFYGNVRSLTTVIIPPTLESTTPVTSITAISANSGGKVKKDGGSAVTSRGVCWSTSQNPTVNDFKTTNGYGLGTFTSSLTGLSVNTTYYVRAYATNSVGTGYGNEITFTTLNGTPVLTTNAVTSISAKSAISGGYINSPGESAVTARGVCWSTQSNPTLNDFFTSNGLGTGNFNSSITGLQPNTTYYVRSWATNSFGTNYGNELEFTTLSGVGSITTTSITSITGISAVSGGDVVSDGGDIVTVRGVVWSNSSNPSLDSFDGYTTDGSGTGTFVSVISPLNPNTTYYVRAYAVNSVTTFYGEEHSFTTNTDGITSEIYYNGHTYQTVIIGGREWFSENLLTTKYNDETSIPLVTNNAEWVSLISPAYCWYDNDQENSNITYGALYNWYAVNTGKLCPVGWHIPSDEEWTSLTDIVGGISTAGIKLKSTTGWYPGGNGTDDYGFTAFPGGFRSDDFYNLTLSGDFWTSSENSSTQAWNRYMNYAYDDVRKGINDKYWGQRVRCLKNE